MIHVLVIIHAGAGGSKAIRQYESKVVSIMREYGGKLLSAFKPKNNPPDEIHLIEFPSEEALTQYQQDSRVTELKAEREIAISTTDLHVSSDMINYS